MRAPTTIELLIVIGTTISPNSPPIAIGEWATNSTGVSRASNQSSARTPARVETRRRRGPATIAPSRAPTPMIAKTPPIADGEAPW